MIAYHGGPFSDAKIAAGIWRKHHAMTSFAGNEQIGIAALPGTRTIGGSTPGETHPGFDFAIIPDVIDGSEEENDDLLAEWRFFDGISVYQLHESPDRL